MKKITIAIDGFSSGGKSTMAKELARKIGYIYIDTGAMYRAVTLYCLMNNLIKDNVINREKLKKEIDNIKIDFHLNPETQLPETYLNGKNVEKEIRGMEVSRNVSNISAIGFVRTAMVKQQQEFGKSKGVVMDGRDIGTVVFPDAELKIFMTAAPEIRARRRYEELTAKGEKVSFEEILENVKQRDHIDQTREESPLKQAKDAIVLDNSNMTKEEQNAWLMHQYLLALEK
ncbi:MAG: (d)CMP kinase [Candidatus Azobacteroides sp.]|nr:(d)CMP kinase [Candidatus Azobacteroides sp.]